MTGVKQIENFLPEYGRQVAVHSVLIGAFFATNSTQSILPLGRGGDWSTHAVQVKVVRPTPAVVNKLQHHRMEW